MPLIQAHHFPCSYSASLSLRYCCIVCRYISVMRTEDDVDWVTTKSCTNNDHGRDVPLLRGIELPASSSSDLTKEYLINFAFPRNADDETGKEREEDPEILQFNTETRDALRLRKLPLSLSTIWAVQCRYVSHLMSVVWIDGYYFASAAEGRR